DLAHDAHTLVRLLVEGARERLLHHLVVLDVERPVEAPVVTDVGDVLVGRGAAGHTHRRVAARDDDEDQEDQEAHGDQHDDHADEASDDERGHQCSIRTFARGSSASRKPSPKMFSESTVSTIAAPGATVSHGAVVIRSWPSAIIVPQDGFGGWTPAP